MKLFLMKLFSEHDSALNLNETSENNKVDELARLVATFQTF